MEVKSNRLTCPSCDGALLSTPEPGRLKCAGCRAEVNLSGGKAETVAPVVEAVGKVQAGTDKVAAEMAIRRLQDELATLMYQRDQIAIQYHQQQASGGAGALVVSVLALIVCWMISAYFFINGSAIGGRVWLLIGIVAVVVVVLAMKTSSAKKGDVLAASLRVEVAPVDRAIHQTRKKIADNRTIAES